MRLEPREMPGWPPLAWLARCGEDVELFHGSKVEVRMGWAYEGAWEGRFADGSFDEVAVSLGSGVRVRNGQAVFASPTSTIDRLCHMRTPDGQTLVSNSLLALVAAAGAEVTDRSAERAPERAEAQAPPSDASAKPRGRLGPGSRPPRLRALAGRIRLGCDGGACDGREELEAIV